MGEHFNDKVVGTYNDNTTKFQYCVISMLNNEVR